MRRKKIIRILYRKECQAIGELNAAIRRSDLGAVAELEARRSALSEALDLLYKRKDLTRKRPF